MWAAPSENESAGNCGQRRPRSACATAQSDLDLHCPLTELLDTRECMNGEQRPGKYFVHGQDKLNLPTLHIFEGTLFALFCPMFYV